MAFCKQRCPAPVSAGHPEQPVHGTCRMFRICRTQAPHDFLTGQQLLLSTFSPPGQDHFFGGTAVDGEIDLHRSGAKGRQMRRMAW